MIGTKLLKGQGLGNQLFCYITARSIAASKGVPFAILGKEVLLDTIVDKNGQYFIDVDFGAACSEQDFDTVYNEKEDRLYQPFSKHDVKHGAYITGVDDGVFAVNDNTLIQGNMQAQAYFKDYIDQLGEWFKVRPEFDSHEYTRDNLCIINIRGGEYTGSPELFLNRKYWRHGIDEMRRIRPDMEFMIITDDVKSAGRLLPGIPAYHFDVARDYVTIKNARYLLLSNSSFACIPALTSKELKFAIAPKYWARYNVSNGFWASEQNIYDIFHYMDRQGRLFNADECRQELSEYQATSNAYKKINIKPEGFRKVLMEAVSDIYFRTCYFKRLIRGLCRRINRLMGKQVV